MEVGGVDNGDGRLDATAIEAAVGSLLQVVVVSVQHVMAEGSCTRLAEREALVVVVVAGGSSGAHLPVPAAAATLHCSSRAFSSGVSTRGSFTKLLLQLKLRGTSSLLRKMAAQSYTRAA
jgi:hypothetical protein